MEVLLSRSYSIVHTLAYFDPKKVHLKAKINLFITFMLFNFLVRMLRCAETLILCLIFSSKL